MDKLSNNFGGCGLINEGNTCSLHVRRGDYLNLPDHHPTQSIEYYKKSVSLIGNDKTYFIFSDDIEWCKENLSNIDNSFIVDHSYKGDRFGEYLELMKNCNHFIIPNSSFAWWSAYLCDNQNKIVMNNRKHRENKL